MSDLSGLHILITRPREQALRWQNLLRSLGAETLSIPVLEIIPVSEIEQEQAIKNNIQELDQFQHLIFVSQNAVNYGMTWVEHYWPQLPVGQNYYAIGSSTASSLQNLGLKVEANTQAMDSEALLQLPQLQSVDGSKVLIFRGVGGRTKIAEVLEQRGAEVRYCELYERALPDNLDEQLMSFQQRHLESRWVVSVHSGESLENLLVAVKNIQFSTLFQSAILVPSIRVAEIAKNSGFSKVIVARNASDDAMTEALMKWRQS
ncbi:uroporphyrinogen-III synthase [Aurantivibrio infirmus]